VSTATLAPPEQKALPPARVSRRRRWLRPLLPPVLVALLPVAAGVAFSVWRDGQLYVSTDNAQLSGEPVQVGAMNAGDIDAVLVKVGQRVSRGDVLARVALPSAVGVAQNGQTKLDFLGSADTRVDVVAPISGVVIATPATAGTSVQPGQPIVSLVDPAALWVNANIDETSIQRVRVGQPVTVHVDALGTDVPGVVDAITPATASTFSLLPSNTTSGTFNKVVQQVPVRISVTLPDRPALLGTSVEVRIQVAE
jgi:multidrug resistance efflux pump